jgi:heme iron utilization protein
MMEADMGIEEKRGLRQLLRARRWAALGTARDNEPLATWVAFAVERDFTGFFLHLSTLSLHTHFLDNNPRASLSVSELDDTPSRDPQALVRVFFQGRVTRLKRKSDAYERARVQYQKRLFHSAQQFQFGDFELFRFTPETGRYVPGLGFIYRVSPQDLHDIGAMPD